MRICGTLALYVLVTPAPRLKRALQDRRIAGVGRRAKNVLIELDDESVV